MSNHLWKNVHLFFSKLKCLPTIQSTPPSDQNQDHHNHPSVSTSSSIIIKNFNSLYNLSSSQTQHSTSLTSTTTEFFSSSSDDSDDTDYSPPPPDFATVFASQRFFFSTPGHSNSIVDSTQHPHPPPDGHDHNNAMFLINESVKVPKYSLDPYVDFRRSMQEMVDARNLNDFTTEWEYLHELLLCYLTLNPKNTHKYIIQAFADLVICILSSSSSSSSSATNHCSESKNRRQQYISQQLLQHVSTTTKLSPRFK